MAESPSQQIDARIKELGDWRGKTLSRVRDLIKQADEVVEEYTRRAIDFRERDEIDEKAFVALIRAAVSLNESSR